ncbi:hypothetical protein MW887_011830 [Aspergillus wentii]|nr:hypothetical protein MW887_011830 [Aspergillus wentii]
MVAARQAPKPAPKPALTAAVLELVSLLLALPALAVTVVVANEVVNEVVEEELEEFVEEVFGSITVPTSRRKALSQQSLPSRLQHQWFKPPFKAGHGKTWMPEDCCMVVSKSNAIIILSPSSA